MLKLAADVLFGGEEGPEPAGGWMRVRRRRAGRSALQVWRAKRRRAFREAWRLNFLSLALVVGCFLGIKYTEGFGELVWAAVFGAILTMHALIWTIGGHVGALAWMQGAWGEQATEEELEKLGAGWHVEHDIPRARGNWDHVVVGRAGVFVIETKWTARSATVHDDSLRFGRVTYSGGGFRGAAVDLRNALEADTGQAPWVTSIVVVWGGFEQGFVQGDRVVYMSGGRVADWLQSQPTRLSELRTSLLADAVGVLSDRKPTESA
jgi:hypothetical protein